MAKHWLPLGGLSRLSAPAAPEADGTSLCSRRANSRRLLVPGSWLGLGVGGRIWTKDEPYKLARIRLDFTNECDFEWDIDPFLVSFTPRSELKR